MASAGNWETCYISRYLQEVRGYEATPPDMGVIKRGRIAEAAVAKAHPSWEANDDRHMKVQLPSINWDSLKGLKVRRDIHVGYPDLLDEDGGPVEVKGMWAHNFEKVGGLIDFIDGHKYQLEYVLQLAGYVHQMRKPGRFVLYSHGEEKGNIPAGAMKEIPMSVEQADEIYQMYLDGLFPVKSCKYCKMSIHCRVYFDAKGLKPTPNSDMHLAEIV